MIATVQRNLSGYLRVDPIFTTNNCVLQAVTEKVRKYYFDKRNNDNILDEVVKVSHFRRGIREFGFSTIPLNNSGT